MKAAFLHRNGDPTDANVLSVLENVDKPVAGKGEILVKVKAAAVNPIDWKLMRGDFPGKKSGLVGCDIAGIIEEIGPECESSSLKVGDPVYADTFASMGSFAEYCLVKAEAASRMPKNLDFKHAAAMPLAGLTALQGLTTHGGFKEGQKVCITGGSGGVGSLAIQMAKAMGAAEIISTGSSIDLIKSHGADTVINYKEKSVVEELEGKELDLVFDTVGGYENWQAAQGALKKGGRFVSIVGDGGSMPATIAGVVTRKVKCLLGLNPSYDIFLTSTKPPDVVQDMKKITEMIESGQVKPVLDDRSFKLTTEGVHNLVKASMSHRAKGKLVLVVED